MEYIAGPIGQIAVTVSNVSSAVSYYRDVLGLKLLFVAGPNLAFLTEGNLRIMLSTPQGSGAVGANSILYFTVKDIESTYVALVERGSQSERAPQLAATMPDHELWLGFLKDPDGNLIGLMEEKR
jgi:predicted enzyme related to lactoylglutathione lyase